MGVGADGALAPHPPPFKFRGQSNFKWLRLTNRYRCSQVGSECSRLGHDLEEATYALQETAPLLDHLVGVGEQGRRHLKPKCLCRFQIDY
jgi:hypothetical protein